MACCRCRRKSGVVHPQQSQIMVVPEELAKRQAALIKLSTDLACEPDIHKMLQTLVTVAHAVLRCERVWLIVESHEETSQHVVRHQAPADGDVQVAPFSVCWEVWTTGEAQNIEDMRVSTRLSRSLSIDSVKKKACDQEASLPQTGELEVRSVLCMPVKDEKKDGKKKVWGVVHAVNKQSGETKGVCAFDDADEVMLKFLVSLCVRRLVDYNTARKRKIRSKQKVRALMQLLADSYNISKQSDVTKFVSNLLVQAQIVFECERTTLFAVDTFKNQLKGYDLASHEGSAELQKIVMPMEGLVGITAESGEMQNVKDAWKDDRFTKVRDIETNFRTRSLLMAPLKTSTKKVVAVLQLVNKLGTVYGGEGDTFSADDEAELLMISDMVSDVLQRILMKSRFTDVLDQEDFDSDVRDMLTAFVKEGYDEFSPKDNRASTSGNLRKSRSTTLVSTDTAGVVNNMCVWDFDHWSSLKRGQHASYVSGCLDHMDLYQSFDLSRPEILGIVQLFQDSYSTATAYHTWDHAFSTFHLAWVLAFRCLLDVITLLDLLALLLAALGHDVEHPGFNNQFLIHRRDVLALRYNDISVLENHHASVAVTILRELVQKWELQTQARFRKVVVTAILGTDMASHAKSIEWLGTTEAGMPELRRMDENLDDKDALEFCTAVLHSVDLSHPTMCWTTHRRLSLLCAEEFYTQYNEEQKLGLPSLPFMGKDPTAVVGLAPSQVGFIQFVVQPLWSALNRAITGGDPQDDDLGDVLANMKCNVETWQGIADGKDEAELPKAPLRKSRTCSGLKSISEAHQPP